MVCVCDGLASHPVVKTSSQSWAPLRRRVVVRATGLLAKLSQWRAGPTRHEVSQTTTFAAVSICGFSGKGLAEQYEAAKAKVEDFFCFVSFWTDQTSCFPCFHVKLMLIVVGT